MVGNALDNKLADKLIKLENDLVWRLTSDDFGVKFNQYVPYIYNPLEYAANLHRQYVEKYCNSPKKVLFLGMNPGPNGMCQTGVPFGEIDAVRDFLKIDGNVQTPDKVHPKRAVLGMNCRLSEPSGRRLWGLVKQISDNDPDKFFKHCYVHNYCPLALFSKTGTNVTPDDLKSAEKNLLNSICDEFLYKVLKLLDVEIVIAVGRYAEKRTLETLKAFENTTIKVVVIQHPSPRNPHSNNNWNGNTEAVLKKHGVLEYVKD